MGDAWAHGRGPPRRRAQCVGRERESLCTAARLGPQSPCQQRRAPRVLVRASLARASAWNRVALTWARGRGCAAPPQATASATLARQLWRPRSRRTRRSRRSNSEVRERARVAAGDGGVGGRLGPRPRAAAQARPMCGEGEGESPCAVVRLGLRSPSASSVGPRAFSCERPLRACFGLESCGADLGSGSRVCCTAAGNHIGDDGATALAAALQKNTTVMVINLECARACSGGRGGWRGWGRLGPRPRPAAQARPMCGEGEREPLRGRAPRAALALPASGRARSRASAPCACFALESCGADLGSGHGCSAPPQGTPRKSFSTLSTFDRVTFRMVSYGKRK